MCLRTFQTEASFKFSPRIHDFTLNMYGTDTYFAYINDIMHNFMVTIRKREGEMFRLQRVTVYKQ